MVSICSGRVRRHTLRTCTLQCMDYLVSREPSWGLAFFAHEGVNCKGEVVVRCKSSHKQKHLSTDTTFSKASFSGVLFEQGHLYSTGTQDGNRWPPIAWCIERPSPCQATVEHMSMLILPAPADHLQATRTAMAREIQYDTFITVYFSDCDYYSRVLRDGWKLASYTDFCPGLDLKVELICIGACCALAACRTVIGAHLATLITTSDYDDWCRHLI